MKALKNTGIALAVLSVLLGAYAGFYWVVNHTRWGREFYSSEDGVYKWYPAWLHDIQKKVLEPAERLEHWAGEEKQRQHIVGEWLSEDAKYRAVVDENYHVTLWGLAKDGFPDGVPYTSRFHHWGVARAYLLILQAPGKFDTTLHVFVDDEDSDLLKINVAKPRGYGLSLRRTSSKTP